ncbi:hypothetical protein F5Y10DRAFT_262806 [Nemania abortiva]|nr:hypothetical protein F5Y10DRAFT_262806 [Nemania abortiva]
MVCPPLARPPPQSPPLQTTRPRIRIRHPGYGLNNILLDLPAVDCAVEPASSNQVLGLHHQTALTAGAIIANNAFDRAYFTHDQGGGHPVTTPLDGILEPGDYWLHLGDKEPGTGVPGPEQGPASTSADEPYPIVPSFGDWIFPHNNLPSEWKLPHHPPGQRHISPASASQALIHCYLTDFQMGIDRCHLIPAEESDWFNINGMGDYSGNSSSTSSIDDQPNIAILRADLRQLFDRRQFVIVPKPSTPVPNLGLTSSTPSTPTAESRSHALVVHVLNNSEAGEFPDLYQNASIRTEYADNLSREFLFARFAWVLFPLLRRFLEPTSSPRRLAVIVEDKDPTHLPHTEAKWMDNLQLIQHLHERGESCTESRKRPFPRTFQDGETDSEDDAYEERWKQRSAGLESTYAHAAYLDPAQKQLDEATRWYEEHGRYAAVNHSDD